MNIVVKSWQTAEICEQSIGETAEPVYSLGGHQEKGDSWIHNNGLNLSGNGHGREYSRMKDQEITQF